MELQWSPPSFTGGSKIILYHITVDPSPSDKTTCSRGECNTTELSFNVTGLKFNQHYTFTVRAENIEGIGNETSLTFIAPGLGMATLFIILALLSSSFCSPYFITFLVMFMEQ